MASGDPGEAEQTASEVSDQLANASAEETVDANLAGVINDEAVLDQPADQAAGLTLRGSTSGAHPIPEVAGGFQAGARIGEGAMADILEAEQATLRRTVALKTLKPQRRSSDDQRTFFAESIATARLEHPNIVPVHDLVRDADGHLQLVMKRVVGRTWKALLHPATDEDEEAADALDLDDHLEFLLKICDAVAYAHSKGVLHRDIKPENVMIGDFGEVLLMDWGCAVTYGDNRLSGMPHLSDLETVSGTPSYMAPEMARGDDANTSVWSDVYLLGGILYEVLTGEPPHAGKTVREVIGRAARGKVPPPRHRNPARAMPDELVELCMAALVPDPELRLSTVKDFAAELRSYRKHGEAYRLAEAARGLLSEAERSQPHEAGRAYRRAVACCEQALDLFPHRSFQMLAVRAMLAAAGHALETGDLAAARSDARAAARWAEELDFEDQRKQAESLVERTRAPEQQTDERLLRQAGEISTLRRKLVIAASVAALAIVVAILATVW